MRETTVNFKYIDKIEHKKPNNSLVSLLGFCVFKNTQNSLDNVIMDLQSQKTLPDVFC